MEALGVLEGHSLARGLKALDVCIKKAHLLNPSIRFVSPGKFVLWMGGTVGDVEESFQDGLQALGDNATGQVKIFDPHPNLVKALSALENSEGVYQELKKLKDTSIGLFEWTDICGAIQGVDAILKGMQISLRYLRFAKGIGGKTMTLFDGDLAEVQAAQDYLQVNAPKMIEGQIIARPDPIWVKQVPAWLESSWGE